MSSKAKNNAEEDNKMKKNPLVSKVQESFHIWVDAWAYLNEVGN